MFLVGLTGGIATGKSTVSRIFREHDIPIIDADEIARSVVEPGKPAYLKIKQEFGPDVFDESNGGILLREKLGRIVFSNPHLREKLNGITHPEIRREIYFQILKHFLRGAPFVIMDLPLLFESRYESILQKIIVVSCTKEQQLERLQARNNYDDATARERIAAQMPLEVKVSRATHVVDNSGTPQQTRLQVESIIKELKSPSTCLFYRAIVGSIIALIVCIVIGFSFLVQYLLTSLWHIFT